MPDVLIGAIPKGCDLSGMGVRYSYHSLVYRNLKLKRSRRRTL
jgi:hypothetical protein